MDQTELQLGKRFNIKNSGDDYSDIWITPKWIIDSLGKFDLDPCAAENMPWETATTMYTKTDNGLSYEWQGRVWCNPPYSDIVPWFKRMAQHGNGIMLVFARTETEYFHKYVWSEADAILFFKGRLSFHRPSGVKAQNNAGAPSVLIAYGEENAKALRRCKLKGNVITL